MRQGIKEKDIRDFEKYAEKLSNVMRRINEYKSEANAYLNNDTLSLMSEDFHESSRLEQQNFIVTEIIMPGFDGGDW